MTYAAVKFKFARSNSLERDTFTRNLTDAQTDGRSDQLWYEIIIPFFSKEKSGFNESSYSFKKNFKTFSHDKYIVKRNVVSPVVVVVVEFDLRLKIVTEYDQEIPESQTAENPMAPRGRAAQPSQDIRKTN